MNNQNEMDDLPPSILCWFGIHDWHYKKAFFKGGDHNWCERQCGKAWIRPWKIFILSLIILSIYRELPTYLQQLRTEQYKQEQCGRGPGHRWEKQSKTVPNRGVFTGKVFIPMLRLKTVYVCALCYLEIDEH